MEIPRLSIVIAIGAINPPHSPPPPLLQILLWAVFVAITVAFARRKNRSALAWAIAGAFLPGLALLVLLFMPYLCPQCQSPLLYDEWKQKKCPRCRNSLPRERDSKSNDFIECPSCHTMIPPGEPKCAKCGWS